MDLLGVEPRGDWHHFKTLHQAVLTAFKQFENGKPLRTLSDTPKHFAQFYDFCWVAFQFHWAHTTSHLPASTVLDKAVEMTDLLQKRTLTDITEVCSGWYLVLL